MKKGTTYLLLLSCTILFVAKAMNAQQPRSSPKDSLLDLFKKEKEDSSKIKLLNSLAWLSLGKSELNEAMQYSEQALAIAQNTGLKKPVYRTYNNMGIIYEKRGNYPEALKNFFRALKIIEASGNKSNLANSYSNIGRLYGKENNFEQAMKYNLEVLRLRKELNDKAGMAFAYNNLGNTYSILRKDPEALEMYSSALYIWNELGRENGIAYCNLNMGIIYKEQGKLDDAEKKFLKALQIRTKTGEREGLAFCYVNLAGLQVARKNFSAASAYYNKSLAIALEMGADELARETYRGMVAADSASGNYKKAHEHYKLYIAYRDSIANEQNTKLQTQLEMQYEFDKKSAADSIKNAEAKRIDEISHQSQIRAQKLYTYAGLAGFLIMIVIALISFVAFRNKQKANLEIARQKDLVEEKQKEILDSIYYARRIQRTLLTSEKYISKQLKWLKKH